MGYFDFDGKRYFDVRHCANYGLTDIEYDLALDSDSRKRPDSIELTNDDVEKAQVNKDMIENVQRAERKLREAAEKRREKGGPKIDYSAYPNHPLNPNK